MHTAPVISIVMPVYNAESHVREAIRSILRQTFTDFEFIIIDDGSTDHSLRYIRSFSDPRIRVYENSHCGLVASLNLGILASSGKYVARMDADDISEKTRLADQLSFMESHPHVAIIGSWCYDFDSSGQSFRKLLHRDIDIKWVLLEGNQFNHGSVMARRRVLVACGMYRKEMFPAEDYDLWLRISERASVANLPAILYRWRRSATQVSALKHGEIEASTRRATELAVQRMLYGRDALGAVLNDHTRPDATFLMIQRFAEKALWEGNWGLGARLLRTAFLRRPTYASRALLSVVPWYIERLWPRRTWIILQRCLGSRSAADARRSSRLSAI